jgi:hypothetical protein
MEHQFNRRHAAVERNFVGGDPVYARHRQSQEWMAGSVAKRIGVRIYDVTLADGSTRRFHANQIRPKSTQTTDDDFTAFAGAFNLPVHRLQVPNGESGHVDKHAVDHNPQTSNQGTPAEDEINPQQSSKASSESRRSKGLIPKKQFELEPRRKTYKYP